MKARLLVAHLLMILLILDAVAAPVRNHQSTRPRPQTRKVPQKKPAQPTKPKLPDENPEPVVPVVIVEPPKPKIVEPDVNKLRNDKEALISAFSKKDQESVLKKYPDHELGKKLSDILYGTMKNFLRENQNRCDLDFIARFERDLAGAGLANSESAVSDYLKLIRITDAIDDILYEILVSDLRDHHALGDLDLKKIPSRASSKSAKLTDSNNLKELYSNFTTFPDDVQLCAFQEFIFLKTHVVEESGKAPKDPLKLLGDLNRKAFEDSLIDLESFNKLEFLRTKSQLEHRYVFLRDYLKIIFQAKNQLVPKKQVYKPIRIEDEDKYSSERLKRFSRLTRRKILYRKYDETQIILLAQVLQKASRRMGTDVDTTSGVPYIVQEFKVDEDGQQKTYVERIELDPQSQFNLARRLLRKDILDLQVMDTFNKLTITYQDVVMAAFETGYISVEDINYVVRYDDLWNPTTSRFERIMGFVMKVSGYATFFLPTPWNVVGTLALGVVEGLVDQKTKTGAENDNPATFIE